MTQSDRTARNFRPLSVQGHFITLLCLAGLGAVWLAKMQGTESLFDISWITFTLVVSLLLLTINKGSSLGRLILLIFLPLVLYAHASAINSSLKVYNSLYDRKVELTGIVQDDAAYNNYGDLEFNIADVKFAGDGSFLPGKLRIRTKQNVAVYRGDQIFVTGTLKPVLGAKTGSISYSTVVVTNHPGSKLEDIRLKFFATIYSSLPEPHASLGLGFLAGARASIPKTLQDQLSTVGLTHIIAVSGYNLTILVMAISKLGGFLSKYQKLVLSFILIFLFLLITGFSPSIVRAAIVSCISLVCIYFGRKLSALNIILISALITASVNPVYLWEDLGWWLSFLAFFGVLILAPTITSLIYKKKEPGLISSICIESFCAQLVTAPLIAHVFGTFSIISLVANLAVLPWIPAIMLLVFIVGSVGMIKPTWGLVLGSLPKIIMTPIIVIIEKLSSLSWASTQLKLSQLGMLACYGFILGFLIISKNKVRDRKAVDYIPLIMR
jgi:competence protein ComEC